MFALPVVAKTKSAASVLWSQRWFRMLVGMVVGGLIVASCPHWPVPLQPLCEKVGPFIELTLGGM